MRNKSQPRVQTAGASTGVSTRTTDGGISAADYTAIHKFLEHQAGIRLGSGKEYLVSSRLGRLLRQFNLNDFSALAKQLGGINGRALQLAVVDAMTTNETYWFRDPAHYKILTEAVLPEATTGKGLRIWSAACSTGQEPYTLSMVLSDARGGRNSLRHEIVGTDISTTVLAQAKAARYCGLAAVRGLDDAQRSRYFEKDGDCLRVRPALTAGVSFREFNLLQSYESLGRFDAVFCRNVLIYFSAERKRDILERIARVINPGGYLFLGSTESMSSHGDLFKMHNKHGGLVYQRL